MLDQIRADLAIIRERDPAARGWLGDAVLLPRPPRHQPAPLEPSALAQPLAAQTRRTLCEPGRRALTGIEIHPGARIGTSVFIDTAWVW